MNFLKYTSIFVFIIFVLLTYFFTFNPIKNSKLIETVYVIVEKIKTYELKNSNSLINLERYYDYIELSDEEGLYAELRGLTFAREGSGFIVTVPRGFDEYLYYNTNSDCWYGDRATLGLATCSDNK